ncbi:MAG: hypothetical protein ACON4K_06740 [Akkermansiaceae bacterium]
MKTMSLAMLALVLPLQADRVKELDAFWVEVSRSVKEGDFEGYKATCHPDAVLVSGKKKTSYAITQALEGWKEGFEDTKAGKMKASVEFRFFKRVGDATTAHETGMFKYTSSKGEGIPQTAYIHFIALLVKKEKWLVLMENQISEGTEQEWNQLRD